MLITHGSLYPWQFALPGDWRAAMLGVFAPGNLWTGTGDVVGNVALFVPLGVLGMAGMRLGKGRQAHEWRRLPALLVFGATFSLALQLLQVFVPARDAALSDVLWNVAGLVIGLLLAGVPRRYALRPLLLDPRWSIASAIETALAVAVFGHLLRASRHRLAWLLALVVLAPIGKLFISGQSISLSFALGCTCGLLLAALLRRVASDAAAMLCICAALVWTTADALRPYELAEQASHFEWIAFVALLQGSLSANALALAANLYRLGVAMVLAAQLGARLAPFAAGIALWVLALEAAQTWLPGRVADITPPLIPLFWLLVLRATSPAGATTAGTTPLRTPLRPLA